MLIPIAYENSFSTSTRREVQFLVSNMFWWKLFKQDVDDKESFYYDILSTEMYGYNAYITWNLTTCMACSWCWFLVRLQVSLIHGMAMFKMGMSWVVEEMLTLSYMKLHGNSVIMCAPSRLWWRYALTSIGCSFNTCMLSFMASYRSRAWYNHAWIWRQDTIQN